MKGLILKDLYTLRQMGKIYLICMVCLVIWGLVTDNPTMLSSLPGEASDPGDRQGQRCPDQSG